MTKTKAYWKRFAASATDYAHKYRFDPFLRTEVNTIALLVLFSLIILAVVGVSTHFLYSDVTSAMSEAVSESLLAENPSTEVGEALIERLGALQIGHLMRLVGIVIAVTVVAGYIVARVVLTPTRNALEFQKQFIGNVAHEVRTPLSIIKTSSEVALLDTKTDADTRTLLTSIIEELNRTSAIINNLLSLSASVRPERIEFRDVDLGATVERAVGGLRRLAEPKQLDVSTRISERRVVWGNASALDQIVTNILKNAIMYTPQKGRVSVTIEPIRPNFIELTVRDSGVGIPREDLPRIFEPYYRVEQSRYRLKGGAGGLGLSIVSELVKLHNGKVTVRSMEGGGTSVIVLLPAGKQQPGTTEEEAVRDEMSEIAVDYSRYRNNTH